jgi:hypothetical protein
LAPCTSDISDLTWADETVKKQQKPITATDSNIQDLEFCGVLDIRLTFDSHLGRGLGGQEKIDAVGIRGPFHGAHDFVSDFYGYGTLQGFHSYHDQEIVATA